MNYRNFLALLSGEKHALTIFEPFPTRQIVTKLIWRGGDELWNTAKRRAETLIGFYEYIKSDVAIIEPRGELSETLSAELPDGMKFVIISDDPDELYRASLDDRVCALATRGEYLRLSKPLIAISRENESADEAVLRAKDFNAVYTAEKPANDGGKILLGGLGSTFINERPPLEIYERVRSCAKNPRWAVGTGGLGEESEYLGFISMLGIYNKLREEY